MRHARLLTELGQHTAVVSSRTVDFPLHFDTLKAALVAHQPDYVVIANTTNLHYDTLTTLRREGYGGLVLVEKPLFDRYQDFAANADETLVAYNLRFHPVIQRLAQLLRSERILSVHAYAGQYLPGWRPATDYRESYSASAARGGGAGRVAGPAGDHGRRGRRRPDGRADRTAVRAAARDAGGAD